MAAWLALAEAPASELTQDEAIDMLRRLTEQGEGRTSITLRNCLHWQLLQAARGLRGRCLRMHLLTGRQRIEKLVRLHWTDVRPCATR